MRTWLLYGLIGLISLTLSATDFKKQAEKLTRSEMQSVIQIMGHDLFEGRAPGTRGGDLAELYCQSMFKWMGLQPGWKNEFAQPFTMKGFTTTELTVESGDTKLKYLEDIVGNSVHEDEDFSIEGDTVFIGFGIKSDIWQWDDFKKSDLKNKIVIVRVNDPGSIDPKMFEGNIMTYFGRWRYKIEEAQAQGAKAILIIHTDSSAGYGWHVVQNSWSGEQLYLPESLENNLKFSGWIKEATLRKLLSDRKINLDKLYSSSMKKSFKPVPLKIPLKITGKCKKRLINANNIVAEIPGKSEKRIVLSAHIDHLGLNPTMQGDQIFNGAIDNGSAVAAMETGSRQVEGGVEQAKQAMQALQQINGSVKRVVEMIQGIAAATRSQSQATDTITVRVEEISEMAKDNSKHIDQTTQASHDLHKLSAHFQQLVSRFQV